MKRWLFALTMLAVGGTVWAGIDADPNNDYVITPAAGPWMICATSYVGPQAAPLAHELVLEIRSRFNLAAYVFNKGEDERRKQREDYQHLLEKYPGANIPFRHTRVEDQCAVLIGGYKDMDAAHEALKVVKKLAPPSAERLMPVLTEVGPQEQSSDGTNAIVKGGYVNPFLNSFVVHNPTVPVERPAPVKADKFLLKLNAHENLSLLKCKKPWTLVVATYQGTQVIQAEKTDNPGFWESLWSHTTGEKLEASVHNAHNMAETLRKIGFEAYVLHVRWGSVVTVGGFDRVDDSQMMGVRTALANLQLGPNVNMLAQPAPMEIPRP
jgi:hypothetical protein